MALSEDVRAELAALDPRRPCCRLAELSALVRGAGSVHLLGGGRVGVHLEVSTPAVARRAFALLRGYGVPAEIRAQRRPAFDRATRFQLHLGDDSRSLQTLNEAGILDRRLAPLERPPGRVVARACCRGAYLRGAFLAAGSVTGPRHPHLELRAADRAGAEFLAGLVRAEELPVSVEERRGHALAYVKAVEAITDLLAFMGAQRAALVLGEHAVVASTRARANRLANADHANARRTTAAASIQLRAIRRLEADGRLADLPRELRDLARLRVRHPTLSLRELAARSRPPSSKAAVQRRLERLRRLAEL